MAEKKRSSLSPLKEIKRFLDLFSSKFSSPSLTTENHTLFNPQLSVVTSELQRFLRSYWFSHLRWKSFSQ